MADEPTPEERAEAERRAEAADEKLESAPHIDFNTFVLSMSSTALVQLGAAPKELFGGAEPPPANLPMAKQTIDLLAMLEEKTRGNLTGEEERLLQQILFDLRMRYVDSVG